MSDKFVSGDLNLFNNNERPFGKHFRLNIADLFKMKYLRVTMEPLSCEKKVIHFCPSENCLLHL